jgi:hypothetical protein
MNHPLGQIFDTLHKSQQASQRSLDQVGRVNHPTLCTVTDNNDPEKKRRIKVSDPAKPALSTDWLRRLSFTPGDDPPLPPVGSTVMCLFDNGDEVRGWYMQCQNATNPAFEKESVQDDWWRETPGRKTEVVGGDRQTTVKGEDAERIDQGRVLSVGKALILRNDAGASLTLHESGAVVLGDAFGNTLVLGGASGGLSSPTDFSWQTVSGNCNWNLGGNQLNIVNASDVTISGKSVATLTALDTGGDALTTRGW